MRRFASLVPLALLACVAAGCAGSHPRVFASRPATHHDLANLVRAAKSENRVGPGPFVPSGGWAGGSGSGLWGDGATGPNGTALGCLDRRRYSYAFGIRNRSNVSVTLTAAHGPDPAPRIVDRVATQFRLSPPYHPSESSFGDLVYRRWSAAPTRPVTVPPGRIATVQSNFLLSHCKALASGRAVAVPGSLVLDYRASGHGRRQTFALPGNRIVLTAGPTRRTCEPVPGSARLVASDVGCGFARRAAPSCRPMQNGGWSGCTVAGTFWECGRFAGPGYPLLETCYLPHRKAHAFSVVWIGGGLGLWGALQNRRTTASLPPAEGVCEVRGRLRALVYESGALALVRGGAARVELSIRGYHGAGDYRVSSRGDDGRTTVRVAAHGFYRATAGRVSVVRAGKRVLSGMVYASLRSDGGTKRAALNGTWSCRVGG